MINYYDLLKPAQKDYYSELLARRLRGNGGGGGVEEIEGVPPLTFQSDGTPLLDWYIKGYTVQNGSPTPDNPIQPQSCGKLSPNVMPSVMAQTVSDKGVTCVCDGKGKYTLSGTATEGNAVIDIDISSFTIPQLGNLAYCFFNSKADSNVALYFYNNTTIIEYFGMSPLNRSGTTLDRANGKTVNRLKIRVANNTTVSMTISPMIVEGTTIPTTFEPYGQYKIPILNNSLTTNVYLGESQSTRAVKKLVLTGEENVIFSFKNDDRARFTVRIDLLNSGTTTANNIISSHLYTLQNRDIVLLRTGVCMVSTGDGITFAMTYSEIGITSPAESSDIVNAFKSFLAAQYAAGTPVTVWYVLATPETATINEPLMKIGDYADSIDMTGTGVNIPTSDGINTLSVNTSVQPSEVYIKYKK